MTHLIPDTSRKRDQALLFGRELKRALSARRVGTRTIADGLGASRTSVMYWRTGRILPRLETAQKLAQLLDWPRLGSLAVELRRKRCLVDDVEFVDDSGSDNRRYCSDSCQRVAEKGRKGSTVDKRAATAERRLTVHQRAVAAFCTGCEPSGRCVTPECALRPVSPLPLFETDIDLDPVKAKPHNGIRTAGEYSEMTARVWAGYTPEQRAARIAKTAGAKRARRLIEAPA